MKAVVTLFLILGFLSANALGVNASAAPAGRDQAASAVVVCPDPPGYTLCRNGQRVSYERFTSITPTLAPYAIAKLGEGKEATGVYVDMRTGESIRRARGLEPIKLVNGVAMGRGQFVRGRNWGILLRIETCSFPMPANRFAQVTVSDCVFSYRDYDTATIKYYGEKVAYLIVGSLLLWGLWKFGPKVSRLLGGNSKSKEGGMSQFGDSYRSEDLGQGRIRFYVTPGTGWGGGAATVILGLVVGGFLGYFFTPPRGDAIFLVLWVIFSAASMWGFRRLSLSMSEKGRKAFPAEFVASPEGLELAGNERVATAKIHRLILRNQYTNAQVPFSGGGGIVAGGTGAVGMGLAAGAVMSNAMSNFAQVSAAQGIGRNALTGYHLDVESGGVAKTLAGGMSESTAYGLLQDVGNALGI